MLKHQLSVDFCVIGGGLSGVCAALAAARHGASVVLVQDRSVLGGNASSEIRMHIVGADCHGSRPGARETGLLEEFKLEDAYRNPHRCYSQWDLLLYEKVTENPNITLLLDTTCDGCEVEETPAGRRIVSAHLIRPSTEDEFVVQASFFADCSGDGRLGSEAGADFRMGREARDEFSESLALPEADTFTLGNSILFTGRKHDTPQRFVRPHWVRTFRKEDFRLRPVRSFEYGYWWAEWGGELNTIKDLATIRHELLRIALGIWDYIKNSGDHPESENWALDWMGALPGKRESRRFLGDHVLTQDDIMGGRIFDDLVAYGGWWLDLHPPQGVDAPDEEPCVQHHIPHLFGIPLRALYSRNVSNLFFAGRNISATHVAFASTRVMGTCAVAGQAIGTAAAVLVSEGNSDIRRDPEVIGRIQQALLRDDAFLPGLTNQDPDDLARLGVCSASSEAPGAPAANVLNGITRSQRSSWGPWSDDTSNHWESLELPASLEIAWREPREIGRVEITFCSGLERELMLTPSDHITSKMIRAAQPEVLKDYNLYVDDALVASVRGNYLRKRVHVFATPARGQALRLHALTTNGYPTARVFEIRAYA